MTESWLNKTIPIVKLLNEHDKVAFCILSLFTLKELMEISKVAKSFYQLAGDLVIINAV